MENKSSMTLKTLIIFFLFAVSCNIVFAQLKDTSRFQECYNLFATNQFEAARNCYLQHDSVPVAVFNAAVVSKRMGDKKGFKQYSKQLQTFSPASPKTTLLFADLQPKTSKSRLKAINHGLKTFSKDTLLLIAKSNFYIATKDDKRTIAALNVVIPLKKSQLELLFFTRAIIWQNMSDTARAISDYKKAIELDQDYSDALYNLAAVYYNAGVDWFNKAEKVPYNQREKYQLYRENMYAEFRKALPWLQRYEECDPGNNLVIQTLKTVYSRLGMFEELKALKEKYNL